MNDAIAEHENCHRCGGPNVIWAAASPLWNFVMRGNDINGEAKYDDLVCMPCFILLAVESGLPALGWRLTLVPEPEGLVYETPSGRVWDPKVFLWVEPGPQYCNCSLMMGAHNVSYHDQPVPEPKDDSWLEMDILEER